MRYQKHPWSCGSAAVVNALRCFGKRVSESRISQAAETSEKDGTTEDGITEALRQFGASATHYDSDEATRSWEWLRGRLMDDTPVILCVDSWQHWVTAVGVIGNRVIMVDPANTQKNVSENSVHVLGRKEMMKRWKNGRESRFFGISVKR